MPLDREDTLKKAEKLLRQGRLDAAIAEYVRVVEDQPRDWNTANTLGDLYVRAAQTDKAVAQYTRIADHFYAEGFYPKASALFKKILKIAPDDEVAQLNLADIAARQGLLKDAKTYFGAVVTRRRARGDKKGADEIIVRLGTLDPTDFEARLAGARVLELSGDAEGAAARFRELYDDLSAKSRNAEALGALKEAVRLNPGDNSSRVILAKEAVDAHDDQAARQYLDRASAGDDAALLGALAGIELRAGNFDEARGILTQMLALDRELRHTIVELAWTMPAEAPEAAFVCVDAVVEAALSESNFDDAAAVLQEFVTRHPTHIPALLKLVEICVDGGLETAMYETQAQLTDAYLAASQAAEARVIAEDLVAREPWEAAHIERFRKALVMLRVSEPDAVIAERLSGQTPFMATDHFYEPVSDEPVAVPAESPVETPDEEPEVELLLDVGLAPEKPRPAPTAAASAVSAVTPKEKPGGSFEIDLTSALGDLGETGNAAPPEPAALDDVFKGLRKESARKAAAGKAAADQSAQHMKLARTYLEMGMLEEAVSSLKTAARSPKQRFEAGSLLGRLYKEQGDMPHAIEWLERAAEASAPSEEDARALLYDLGVTLEEEGETARALGVFLELQADAEDYRDVPERAERLARVRTGG
ncbi:MAG: tetratricopeptide repeat protein [Acidobacteriota bacterium]